jgi:hypothetical protein
MASFDYDVVIIAGFGGSAPHLDQATRMLGAVRYPYMPTDVDRVMRQVAIEMGRGETFNKAPVGVYFGSPGVEADDPYFGAHPEQGRRAADVGDARCHALAPGAHLACATAQARRSRRPPPSRRGTAAGAARRTPPPR